ncbi:MAG: hypothetical protein CMP48_27880 [Rickettsiales bacterium]|nr:hypothetical protein [Rickettsiales bacterium]MBR11485.1 hypothetical protein [Rickettsiales bacterium]
MPILDLIKPPAGRYGHWRPVTPVGRFPRPGCQGTRRRRANPNPQKSQPPKNLTPNPGINRGLFKSAQRRKMGKISAAFRTGEPNCPDQALQPRLDHFFARSTPIAITFINRDFTRAHFDQKNVFPSFPHRK